MLRRVLMIASVAALFAALLSGCGSKNADSVVKDLSKVADKLESYQGSGTMTLHTGQQPLTYKVEVWYQKPQFYRIALTNAERDITQIVLRNDQGVFVLTPSLNKSYRFQSEWPENQGQVYLYQTLLQSITLDNQRQFTTDKDAYVFNVLASNYQNGSFARQKIWLSKTDYAPQQVQVTDPNQQLMVEVKFSNFEFGKKFDKSAFDMQQNMASSTPGAGSTGDAPSTDGKDAGADGSSSTGRQDDGIAPGTTEPTIGDGTDADGAVGTGAVPEGSDGSDGSVDAASQELPAIIEPDPDALPEGVSLKDTIDDLQLDGLKGVMLRYTGTYDFSILESTLHDTTVLAKDGLLIDLGFTAGQLTSGDTTQSLTWTYDGVEYRLTTSDLPQEDMIRVAQSMVESSGK